MNTWSNIQISSHDSEINKINDLEKRLGVLTDNVNRIRELITRFEVCHFKYKIHLTKIKDSITNLNSNIDTTKIGANHIQHGENVLKSDTTGRSLKGQQYIWALMKWLKDDDAHQTLGKYNIKLGEQIQTWLGYKNSDKVRLVKLLLARLRWDWASYENLQQKGKFKDIEAQASRMDICHYAFPENLDLIIKGIGKLKAVEEKFFEGCGSFNTEIKTYLEKEFTDLNNVLNSFHITNASSKNDLIKKWLILCLVKTIKENIKIEIPVNGLGSYES